VQRTSSDLRLNPRLLGIDEDGADPALGDEDDAQGRWVPQTA
jgi:hypothetical protein